MFGTFTDMPRLGSYERALNHYNSIKPIRGRTEDVRPLCNTTNGRRKTHLRILTTTYDELPAVACRYCHTDVVTYVIDGRVVFSNDYPSLSTNQFASELLPHSLSAGQKHSQTWLFDSARGGDAYWVPAGEVLEMKQYDNRVGWYPVNAHIFYKHVVNRKTMREVTEQYKPFIEHCVNVAKLLGASVQEDREYHAVPKADALRDSEREGWGGAIKYFVQSAVVVRWDWHAKHPMQKDVRFDMNKLKKLLADYIKTAHHEDILERVAVPVGVCANDVNAKYLGAHR